MSQSHRVQSRRDRFYDSFALGMVLRLKWTIFEKKQKSHHRVFQTDVMLHIFYGDYKGDNYIFDPDTWFNNQADRKWLLDDLSRKMIQDVDKSEVVSENLIQSSRLGPIPPQWLSGGVKTLILIDHDKTHVFNASACGPNCAKWLLEIGKEKDVLVRLGYLMDFGEGPFEVEIENIHQVVHNQKEIIETVLNHQLL